MNITVYTDGGSLNNPGPAAIAFIIYRDRNKVASLSKAIGVATNNTAEYKALIAALEKILELSDSIKLASVQKITTISDSELMVRQLNGIYKVKKPDIKGYIDQIRVLKSRISVPFEHTHVLREKNTEADALVKQALGR